MSGGEAANEMGSRRAPAGSSSSKSAHVAEPQVEIGVARARLLEHRRRGVDPDHAPAGRTGNLRGNAPRADGELDDRPVGPPARART
jgi:hypothetical protein